MSKIHIALVGGQPIPVYLGIMEDEGCGKIILIHSSTSKKEAERISKSINKDCTYIECSPNNIEEIKSVAEDVKKQYGESEITLNITSGTKPWSLIFYHTFYESAKRIIYIDQLNRWYDLKTDNSKTLDIDIFKRFELYGTPLEVYKTLDFFDNTDYVAIGTIENVRKINIGAFNDLTNREEDAYSKETDEISSRNGSLMRWDWNAGWVEFEIVGYNGLNNDQICIESDHIKEVLLHNAWFELKTAFELKKNNDVKNIYIGSEFLMKSEEPKNECDIIVDFGSRLVFVECKTMIYDVTDIDKFRSAMRNFSGTSSIGMFVTNDRVSRGRRYDRYNTAMEKCRDNDILTFNFELWDGNDATSLNSIIEREIQRINKR